MDAQKQVLKAARRSWEAYCRDGPEDGPGDLNTAARSYQHAIALDPENDEIRSETEQIVAAKYAAKHTWREKSSAMSRPKASPERPAPSTSFNVHNQAEVSADAIYRRVWLMGPL